MMFRKRIAYTLFGLLIASAATLHTTRVPVRAQTPPPLQIMLTWEASGYVPRDYRGRTLPTRTAPIRVAVSLIEDQKVVDLSGARINWVMNNKVLSSGIGKTSFSFSPTRTTSGDYTVTARIERTSGVVVEKSTRIPNAAPSVTISIPLQGNSLATENISLEAIPYFFPVEDARDLIYRWTVNNQILREGGDTVIDLTFPKAANGTAIAIDVRAFLPSDSLMSGSDARRLIMQR